MDESVPQRFSMSLRASMTGKPGGERAGWRGEPTFEVAVRGLQFQESQDLFAIYSYDFTTMVYVVVYFIKYLEYERFVLETRKFHRSRIN